MHENNIVHHDIKCENIMVKMLNSKSKEKENSLYRCLYGDFGFSMKLDKKTHKELNDELYSISGTVGYFPPEVYCLDVILDYRYETNMNYLAKKVLNMFSSENFESLEVYGLKKMGVSLNGADIMKSLVPFITRMRSELLENRYFNSFYNKNNARGYVYLNDIYALGIVFSAMYNFMKIDITDDIKSLVQGMTAFNPDDRFNIYDCISHHIFNDIRGSIHKYKKNKIITKKLISNRKIRKSSKRTLRKFYL